MPQSEAPLELVERHNQLIERELQNLVPALVEHQATVEAIRSDLLTERVRPRSLAGRFLARFQSVDSFMEKLDDRAAQKAVRAMSEAARNSHNELVALVKSDLAHIARLDGNTDARYRYWEDVAARYGVTLPSSIAEKYAFGLSKDQSHLAQDNPRMAAAIETWNRLEASGSLSPLERQHLLSEISSAQVARSNFLAIQNELETIRQSDSLPLSPEDAKRLFDYTNFLTREMERARAGFMNEPSQPLTESFGRPSPAEVVERAVQQVQEDRNTESGWRALEPTEDQIRTAAWKGLELPKNATRGEVFDLIASVVTEDDRKWQGGPPPVEARGIPATPGQQQFLADLAESRGLEVELPDGATAGDASDLIIQILRTPAKEAVENADSVPPLEDDAWREKTPTSAQLGYASRLGIEIPDGASRGEVSDLIAAAGTARRGAKKTDVDKRYLPEPYDASEIQADPDKFIELIEASSESSAPDPLEVKDYLTNQALRGPRDLDRGGSPAVERSYADLEEQAAEPLLRPLPEDLVPEVDRDDDLEVSL